MSTQYIQELISVASEPPGEFHNLAEVIIIDYPLSKPSSLPLLPPSNEEQEKSYEIKSKSSR
jgi:hypothetical protein